MKQQIVERNGAVVARQPVQDGQRPPVYLWPPLKPDEFVVVRTTRG